MRLPALPVADPLATLNFERLAMAAPDPGDLKPTARATAPVGWLLCDGAAISRTEYAVLYAAIGTAYGAGNGTTTFNVPNLLGRVPMGADPSNLSTATGHTAHALGASGGEETHTLTTPEIPSHTHGPAAGDRFMNRTSGPGLGGSGTAYGQMTAEAAATGVAGGDGAHNNLPPYVAVNWLVKT